MKELLKAVNQSNGHVGMFWWPRWYFLPFLNKYCTKKNTKTATKTNTNTKTKTKTKAGNQSNMEVGILDLMVFLTKYSTR